jgi:hypothetical protein
MTDKFKGTNHVIQSGIAASLLAPRPTPGTPVRYNDEIVGVVDSVIDDCVMLKINPDKIELVREKFNTPGFTIGARE